jgi:hypothetical protein
LFCFVGGNTIYAYSKNKIEYALTNPLILKKLEKKSHSFIGNYSMAKYSDLIKNYFEGMVNEDSNDYA